jgi:hypothetical protein
MKAGRLLTLAAVCLLASACYHQVVQTGRTPGSTVVHKPWVPTWIFGLVPATPIDVTSQCPRGIATVETQMSFLNGLVGGLTFGIFTPHDVKITCATGSAMTPGATEFYVARSATQMERDAVIAAAVDEAARTGQRVVIRF